MHWFILFIREYLVNVLIQYHINVYICLKLTLIGFLYTKMSTFYFYN